MVHVDKGISDSRHELPKEKRIGNDLHQILEFLEPFREELEGLLGRRMAPGAGGLLPKISIALILMGGTDMMV